MCIRDRYEACYLKRDTSRRFLHNMKLAYQALFLEEKKYMVLFSDNDSMNGKLYDFPEILTWLQQYYESVVKMAHTENTQKTYRPEVERAMAYIREHYADAQMKVSDIAAHLKISESRISAVSYTHLRLKKEGKSILMISEELTELLGMSDRIIVLKDGVQTGEFRRDQVFTEQMLIEVMI